MQSLMTSGILAVHVGAGSLALGSGLVALSVRKGGGPHRAAGTVFVLSMEAMSATAIYLALVKNQPSNILGGLLTIYLIATAWMAGKRKDGETGAFEIVAALAALVVAAGILFMALEGARDAAGAVNGVPLAAFYVFCAVIGLAAALDISVVVRRGLFGPQRIARHLWRMCSGMFIAIGSFAAQGAKVLPDIVGETHVLLLPMIAIVVVLFYWLFRVLLTNWYAGASGAAQSQAHFSQADR